MVGWKPLEAILDSETQEKLAAPAEAIVLRRFDAVEYCGGVRMTGSMEEVADGDFVRFEDCDLQRRRIEALERVNDQLRKKVAESSMDCLYCGLSKADMAKCVSGFPGCGRADDMMI